MGRRICLGVLALCMVIGGFAQAARKITEGRVWNVKDIPMPHLMDASRYVSNPDRIITSQTEKDLNAMLKVLDETVGIESSVVIVGHVENGDAHKTATDIGNRYGVGRGDRGLVIVVAIKDHSCAIATGTNLERELTDDVCGQLLDNHLIPKLKSGKTDEAMLSLVAAVCYSPAIGRHSTPAAYELAFTYGWFSDPESVKRKRLLGIEMDGASQFLPKDVSWSRLAMASFQKILELNDPAYPRLNAEAAYRMALYYAIPNSFFMSDTAEAKSYLLKAKQWAEKSGDSSLLQRMNEALQQM